MTIDEAIKHCEEVANGQTEQGKCPECAEDHRQLAEWLKELKAYRERMSCDDEGVVPKSIAMAFQFGMAFGFAKKYDEMDKVMEEVKKTFTPQPKMGRWIIIDDCEQFIAKCSECGRIEDSRMISKYPYCHCGAKMQAESEGEA